MGDWCVIQDGGVADRYATQAEAEEALPMYVEAAQVVRIPDPMRGRR